MLKRLWEFTLKAVNVWLIAWLTVGGSSHPLLAATFYVDPVSGNDTRDATQAQDPGTPWRSLTRAVEAGLSAGDVIRVAPGELTSVSGESFPIAIPSDVAVVGSGAGVTRVTRDTGSQPGPVFSQQGPLGDQTTLAEMTLSSGGTAAGTRGVDLAPELGRAALAVDAVAFDGSLSGGIYYQGTGEATLDEIDLTVSNSTFRSGDGISFALSGVSNSLDIDLELDSDDFFDESDGIEISLATFGGVCSLSMDAREILMQGSNGIVIEQSGGVGSELDVDLLVDGATFDGATGISLEFYSLGSAEADTLLDINAGVYNSRFVGVQSPLSYRQTNSDEIVASSSLKFEGNVVVEAGGLEFLVDGDGLEYELDIAAKDNSFQFIGDEVFRLNESQMREGAATTSVLFTGNTILQAETALRISLSSITTWVHTAEYLIADNQIVDVGEGIEFSEYGIDDGSVSTVALTISNNSISRVEDDAISISFSSASTASRIESVVDVSDNIIADVQSDAMDFGYYYMYDGSEFINSTTISGNDISNIGSTGIYLSLYSFSTASADVDLLIEGNTFTNIASSAISLTFSSYSSSAAVAVDATIAGNTISNASEGIYVEVSSLSTMPSADFDIQIVNNDVFNVNRDGIYVFVDDLSYPELSTLDLTIAGNTVDGVGEGAIILSASSVSEAAEANFLIAGNTATGSSSGIELYLSGSSTNINSMIVVDNVLRDNEVGLEVIPEFGYSQPVVEVQGNTITNNAVGVELGYQLVGRSPEARRQAHRADRAAHHARKAATHNNGRRDPHAEKAVKFATASSDKTRGKSHRSTAEGASPVDLGGGGLSDGANTFLGNRAYNVMNNLPDDGFVVPALQNYWGVTDVEQIDGTNFDDEETEGFVAAVDVGSPLAVAPDSTGVVALLAAEQTGENSGLEGISPGDSVRLSLSVTTIGTIGCAVGTFDIELPEGVSYQVGSFESADSVLLSSPEGSLRAGLPWIPSEQQITLSFVVDLDAEIACEDFTLQGSVTCLQQGEVLTDDEALDGTSDPTLVSLATLTYYDDGDGDGAGSLGEPVRVCFEGAPEGYVANSTDCDDNDDDSFPGGSEICDGQDNDCNGQIDNGVQLTFYADSDSDGYGNADQTLAACAPPKGYVAQAGDCNDDEEGSNPAAIEACDNIDNDCDGGVDNGAGYTYYADDDADGFGDPATGEPACARPDGRVSNSSDCNDANGDVYPGAEEVCDSVDNNCDGQGDEGLLNVLFADADGDGFGGVDAVTLTCETSVEGYSDNGADCDDTNSDVNPDADEVCDGVDNNCDGVSDDLTVFFADTDEDGFGDPAVNELSCGEAPDGFVDNGDDCDDRDEDSNPDADEVCDGQDNNCDGQTDEDLGVAYFVDADEDGFGSAEEVAVACDGAPEGFVESADDCDDTSEDVNPDAEELCDGIDNNCDGGIDEDVTIVFFIDADNDGYGSGESYVIACEAPAGHVDNADDCLDSEESVNPEGTEICDDLDNDCNGVADDAAEACDVVPDESPTPNISVGGGGCGCDAGGRTSSNAAASLLMLGLVLWRRRVLR